MNQDTADEQTRSWEEEHPWLSCLLETDSGDDMDEVIRYTLDEIRIA